MFFGMNIHLIQLFLKKGDLGSRSKPKASRMRYPSSFSQSGFVGFDAWLSPVSRFLEIFPLQNQRHGRPDRNPHEQWWSHLHWIPSNQRPHPSLMFQHFFKNNLRCSQYANKFVAYVPIWWFPKIGGTPQIIHFSKMFHYKPSSYWGTLFWETPNGLP